MTCQFVHLRLHSEYSINDGMVRLDPAIEFTRANGGAALGITDQMNVFGALRFYSHAIDAGIKPVVGCDLWISRTGEGGQRIDPWRLTVLCQNHEGYLSLCRLLSRGWLENQILGRGEVDWTWLTPENTKGLVCLSGGPRGRIEDALLQGDEAQALGLAGHLRDLFADRFYLELQRAGRPDDRRLCLALARLAVRTGIPVVATHPVQFLRREEFAAHEARCCIAQGYVLSDASRPRPYTQEQYLKSQEEMLELFRDCPAAVKNTLAIAERCSLDGVLQKPQLPLFPTPEGVSLDDYMVRLAHEGLEKRLEFLYPDRDKRDAVRGKYVERLDYELGIISRMKFPGYFLIVQDFINWSKRNGVPVGPGRGSGAGSLVAYSLGITDLDPLHYGLLFERFLNPERVSMPDFDVDFCQFNRDRTIEYVKRSYGEDAVSQIVTFGAMGAKAVVRDVGRVLGMGYEQADRLAKLIPQKPGLDVTLEKAAAMDAEFRAKSQEPEYEELMTFARSLEGLTRNLGMHAGGVLIAPGRLTDFCPLYNQDGRPENTVSQFDKKDIERVGLVKFDFLGLTTLTILTFIKDYIDRLHPDREMRLEKIPTHDEATLDIFRKGDTGAVFQFESDGMRDQLRQAQPDCLEDLVALNALYRPGPMDQIPHFINRKFGREKVEYLDPRMEPILRETYGIMVYQEQVMLVAQAIAGYSLGGADLLRRAMGKKNVEEMKRQRAVFLEGAAKNGVTAETATKIFDLMEKFAGYGFNKSHAAAYSYVAWQTAYLKAHYPAEFTAGNLCLVMDQGEKMSHLVDDARERGVTVLPPDINRSQWYFTVPDSRTVRFGLGAVKGVGEGVVEQILMERGKNGPYRDLFDLAARVQGINRRVMEQLVKAGVFDSIDEDRGKLFANVSQALQAGQAAAAAANQASLFGGGDGMPERIVSWTPAEPWSDRQKYQAEREALGFLLTGGLWSSCAAEIRALQCPTLASIRSGGATPRQVLAAGILSGVRTVMGKRGKFAIATLTDGETELPAVFFSRSYMEYKELFRDDAVLLVTGKTKFNERDGACDVIVDRCQTLEDVRRARQPVFQMRLQPGADLAALGRVFAQYRDQACLETQAVIETKEAVGRMRLGDDFRSPVCDEFAEKLRRCSGVVQTRWEYR